MIRAQVPSFGEHGDMVAACRALASAYFHPLSLPLTEYTFWPLTYPADRDRGALARIVRGLIEEVQCDWPWWVSHSPDLLGAHRVRRVAFTTFPHLRPQDDLFDATVRFAPYFMDHHHNLRSDYWFLWNREPGQSTDDFLRAAAFRFLREVWPGIAFLLPGDIPFRQVP
jgi:hypothetical protein